MVPSDAGEDTVPLLQAECLAALPGLRHGFTTRAGGVSRGGSIVSVGAGADSIPAITAHAVEPATSAKSGSRRAWRRPVRVENTTPSA